MANDSKFLERNDVEKHITQILDKEICLNENEIKNLCEKVIMILYCFSRLKRF